MHLPPGIPHPAGGVFPSPGGREPPQATYPDQVDEDVKRRRVELITELQLAVVDDWCESMMGQVVEVLCEGYDDETELYYGRSYADSPAIDGLVHFEGEEGGRAPRGFLPSEDYQQLRWGTHRHSV